jgi:hypothetical protein
VVVVVVMVAAAFNKNTCDVQRRKQKVTKSLKTSGHCHIKAEDQGRVILK